jgi:hypothetical protein
MELATLTLDCDRFDYIAGSWLFWSEHHSGQWSEGYSRLSRYQFEPGAAWRGWQSLSEASREVYRAWCEKQSVDCDYDSLAYVLKEAGWDTEDSCTEYLLDRYSHSDPNESGLCDYDRSDFVNLAMCYTRDLLRFYEQNSESVLHWCDQACEAYGYTSRLELLEGQTVEDPDGMATGLVNVGMTYLAGEMLRAAEEWRDA